VQEQVKRTVISALVDNHSGVLVRVAGLFSRRGFNIDSLTVCETENPLYSRMTIVVPGDYTTIKQVVRQLAKLEDTKKILILDKETTISSELLLVKVQTENGERASVLKTAQAYGAKILDTAAKSVTLELTGSSQDIDVFIGHLERNGILELARTGMTALSAGDGTINQ